MKKSASRQTPFILILLLGGMGLFVLGFWVSSKTNVLKPTIIPTIYDVPYGDENLDTDREYQEAMNRVSEGVVYNSPFGYTITLPGGWRVVNELTIDDKDGKREVFSPYSKEEVKQMLDNDPYNPNYYFEVEVRENPKNVSLTDWTTKSNYSPQSADQKNFNTTVAGHPAVKVIGNQGDAYVDYYVQAGNKVFDLGYFFTQGDQWKSPSQFSIQSFEDIVSSFKTP